MTRSDTLPINPGPKTEDAAMQSDLPTIEFQLGPYFWMMNVQLLILLEYGINDIFCNLGKECSF